MANVWLENSPSLVHPTRSVAHGAGWPNNPHVSADRTCVCYRIGRVAEAPRLLAVPGRHKEVQCSAIHFRRIVGVFIEVEVGKMSCIGSCGKDAGGSSPRFIEPAGVSATNWNSLIP
jgi:hypothetical protein